MVLGHGVSLAVVAGDSTVGLAVAMAVDLGGCLWFCELEILLEFLGL